MCKHFGMTFVQLTLKDSVAIRYSRVNPVVGFWKILGKWLDSTTADCARHYHWELVLFSFLDTSLPNKWLAPLFTLWQCDRVLTASLYSHWARIGKTIRKYRRRPTVIANIFVKVAGQCRTIIRNRKLSWAGFLYCDSPWTWTLLRSESVSEHQKSTWICSSHSCFSRCIGFVNAATGSHADKSLLQDCLAIVSNTLEDMGVGLSRAEIAVLLFTRKLWKGFQVFI